MVIDTSTAGLVYILASVVLPIVVAFITKQQTLGKYKAYVLLFLSALTSFLYNLHEALSGANSDYDIKGALVGAVVTFAIAAATYAGLWKPAEVTPAIQEKTADIGI